MESSRTVHVLIQGRVQGVGFRAWVQHNAELRGLEGWVRNRRDGTVEAVFSGPAGSVAAMLTACRQGPSSAVVEKVDTAEGDRTLVSGSGPGRFEVLRTI